MTRGWKLALALVALVVLAVALAIGAALVWVLPEHVGSLSIDGRSIDLHQAHAGHWLLASVGVFIALMICLVVVPLVAVLVTLVPLLGAGIAVILVLAVLALVFSPIPLLGWWLWKRSDNKATIAA